MGWDVASDVARHQPPPLPTLRGRHHVPGAGETHPVAIPSCTSAWKWMDPSAIKHQDLHSGDAGCHWQGQVVCGTQEVGPMLENTELI